MGATRGNWQDVWATFDQRRGTARANDGGDEGGAADAAREPDMFGDASGAQAAE